MHLNIARAGLLLLLAMATACNPFKAHPAYASTNDTLNEAQSGCFVVDQWVTGIKAFTAAATVVTGASGIATLAKASEDEAANSSGDEKRTRKVAITSIVFAGLAAAAQVASSGMEARYEKKDCPAILRDVSKVRTAELGATAPLPALPVIKGYKLGGAKKFVTLDCVEYDTQVASFFYSTPTQASADGASKGACTAR